MARRNPAFRVAIGGLAVAVGLCLVGAISLLSSAIPNSTSSVDTSSVEESPITVTPPAKRPIQVATTGDVHSLFKDSNPQRPVPESPEYAAVDGAHEPGDHETSGGDKSPTTHAEESIAPVDTDSHFASKEQGAHSPPATSRHARQFSEMESEISQLRGQVSDLAQSHLESQLAEIRHAEQLLSAHQTNRMIEELLRDVDELRSHHSASQTEINPAEEPTTSTERDSTAVAEETSLQSPSSEEVVLAPPRETPAPLANTLPKTSRVCTPAPVDPPTVELASHVARVRFMETPDSPGRFNVDADDATLPEFLAKLGPVVSWNLVSDPRLTGTVTVRWVGVDLKQALIHQLKVHGWQIREEDDFAMIEPLIKPETATDSNLPQPFEAIKTIETSPSVSIELAQEAHEGSTYDQATGILIQPRQTSAAFEQRPRIVFNHQGRFSATSTPADHDHVKKVPVDNAVPHTGMLVSRGHVKATEITPKLFTTSQQLPAQIEIEATIIQSCSTQGDAHGQLRTAIEVTGLGPCAKCGQVHALTSLPAGHAIDGWFNLNDGISCGVSSSSPELIVARLQKLSAATVTPTLRDQVQSGQRAEIGLTEKMGFRRHIDRGAAGSEQFGLLQGGIQLTLRPTLEDDGTIRLEVGPTIASPDTISTERCASVKVSPGHCVVIGGLFFDSVTPTDAASSSDPSHPLLGQKSTGQDMHEVVVLISVRHTTQTTPPAPSHGLSSPAPSSLLAPPTFSAPVSTAE